MELENAYSKVTQAPLKFLQANGRTPVLERDPTIQSLEHSVSRQIAALALVPLQKQESTTKQPEIRNVSVEDLIKELLELQKS